MRSGVAVREETLRVFFVLLQHWHTMLVGPPGTGKTMLVERAAELWNVELLRVTPSMDWTAFHAIGGKAPRDGSFEPYDGAVTSAVLDCCRTVIEREATGDGPQATWLLIDEINRCEVDRVFSSLLTTLGSRLKPQVLDLPYRDEPTKRRLTLPPRFRIIATANLSDSQFVEQMSQAFMRRFQRIELRTPDPPLAGPSIESFDADDPAAAPNDFLQEMGVIQKAVAEAGFQSMDLAMERIAQLALLVRYALSWSGFGSAPIREDPLFDTVAIGTAQLVDALLLAGELQQSPAGLTLEEAVDVAIARTVAPQLGRVGPESLKGMRAALTRLDILPRVNTELATLIARSESGSYF
jgi:MoxR-like ATPase